MEQSGVETYVHLRKSKIPGNSGTSPCTNTVFRIPSEPGTCNPYVKVEHTMTDTTSVAVVDADPAPLLPLKKGAASTHISLIGAI